MLQAFEPLLDMSQDIDICAENDLGNNHDLEKDMNICSGHPASSSERANYAETVEVCGRGKDEMDHDLPQKADNEEIPMENCYKSFSESRSINSETNAQISGREDDIEIANGNVRCIIRNIVRDWASEGQRERDQCCKPILEELVCLFPQQSKARPPSCLVPGAGWTWEIGIGDIMARFHMSGK
ncbi:uncharacterized protein [Aristolochia californica]|uniref:uncharacterized protein isoform X2 n=1 Tax=Aristolochia californica TaxID=171875 RepID=UPI0035D5895C